MDSNLIKKIRKDLELTQEDLAIILGTTKVSIARYESGNSSPQGDTKRKLLQLECFLKNINDKEKLIDMRRKEGGVAAIAGLVSIGVATVPAASIMLSYSIGTLAATAPAILLGTFLLNFLKNKK